MPSLLQALNFDIEHCDLSKEEATVLKNVKKIKSTYKRASELIGDGELTEFEEKANSKIEFDLSEIRNKRWIDSKFLPKELTNIITCDEDKTDEKTILNILPKVKVSEIRRLADKFNMIVIPIEYSEPDKLFDLENDKVELKATFKYFKELIEKEKTTNYQAYMLCPINYYNVWEQIKSEVVRNIYYPEYFEQIFTTLDLMIPSQKNLYLSSQINHNNIQELNGVFEKNLEALSSKINSISAKISKLENSLLNEKYKNALLNDKIEKLNKTLVKQQEEIAYLYCRLDPLIFVVPESLNIVEDEETAIIGMCWGKDIDEVVFEMKEINIVNSIELINEKLLPLKKIYINKKKDIYVERSDCGLRNDGFARFDNHQYMANIEAMRNAEIIRNASNISMSMDFPNFCR